MGNGIAEKYSIFGDCLIQGKKVWVGVSRADGSKCERCWNYSTKVGSFSEHPTLCSRRYNVVGIQSLPVVAAVEEMLVLAVHEYRKSVWLCFDISVIFQIIQRFSTVDLSNFYFDVAKDRLWVTAKDQLYSKPLKTYDRCLMPTS
ncbi:hypothetical protein IFM89_023446 [Coptis chinensis]|uniref:Zinc finger FPG/IleRS-type domain-containing protein n=1 Tax=Coptis chinensis TaxID=261450 RepID=A0A835MAL3_9MAGN|nr:hypothetical protein IFM89_023446 [Coptis chinensis]